MATKQPESPRETWARADRAAKRRSLEDLFEQQLRAHGLPTPVREHQFHESRAWRFDFAWPAWKLAVEIDGGTFGGGRHVRPRGFENDAEKLNAATSCGWLVYRYTSTMVRSGHAVTEIRVVLERASRDRRP
jgi:very-short-patch-repair endonuclease